MDQVHLSCFSLFKVWVIALSDEFQVEFKAIGSGDKLAVDSLFEEKETDLSQFLQSVKDEYAHLNLQGVVLASDGIFNKGRNPLYVDKVRGVPVHSILLGDTIKPRDLNVVNLFHNDVTFLGDEFEVEIDLDAQFASGNRTKVEILHYRDGSFQLEKDTDIRWNDDQEFKTQSFLLKARDAGVQRYRVRVSSLPQEENVKNNVRDFFIEVLDSRKKIVLVRESPHPDVTAIKQMVEDQDNLEIEIVRSDDYAEGLDQADLMILHGLPTAKWPMTEFQELRTRNKVPVLFILDETTDLRRWNQMQSLLKVERSTVASNEVNPKFQSGFDIFEWNDEFLQFEDAPPLVSPFGQYSQIGGQTLALQQIDRIDTDYPLIVLGDNGGIKTGVIAGSGLWRWRMADYYQHQSFEIFDDLLGRMIQYLALKENRERFRVKASKNIFDEQELISFSAELYNNSFENINDPEVNMVLKSKSGQEYPYSFSRVNKAYRLDISELPVGSYSYRATTKYNGKSWSQKGQFVIQAIDLEFYNTVADHGLLRSLARQTGGQVVTLANTSSLAEELLSKETKPVVDYQSKTTSLIHVKWLLALLILLLAIEWFLRRYFGRY